jgi:hypothetical protein
MNQLNDVFEQAGYLEFHGDQIYAVLHGAPDPIARVLLVGPFASERYFSWSPWVRWGRYLSARGMEALRFEYRGVGESTGQFEDMSFREWMQDVEFLAGFLEKRRPRLPLILHGLELGAVFASKIFDARVGDALLIWSDPKDANQVLRRPLSRHGFRNMFARKSAADYIRELQTRGILEVEGYQWSNRLWTESFTFQSRVDPGAGTRPARRVNLEGTPASLLKGSAMGSVLSLDLDLTDLYAENFEWMMEALRAGQETQ